MARPEVRGKFLYAGNRKLYVRGVTYGTFRPDEQGCEYGDERTWSRMLGETVVGVGADRLYPLITGGTSYLDEVAATERPRHT